MAATRIRQENSVPSSSPAFGTPVHPIIQARPIAAPAFKPQISTILPILLPPPSLRPLAFRTFTKKHNLTLSSPALQSLATFIGRHCGSGWREEGTAEKVLEDVAKTWKKNGGAVIVNNDAMLKSILKTLEGCMSGGRIVPGKSGLSRQSSFAFAENGSTSPLEHNSSNRPGISGHNTSFGISSLAVNEPEDEEEHASHDPRSWLKCISAFEQPRLTYDMQKKHFVALTGKPSLLPPPSHKTTLFRDRYNLIHQRLLRNPAFQAPTFSARAIPSLNRSDSITTQQFYKITPIANLLGRSGSSHLLLGMLVVAPTGTLALNDLSGSIALDLGHAQPLTGPDSAFFCPGMVVLIEGMYEEEYAGAGSAGLGSSGGVGGTIPGKFIGLSIGGPPCERRNATLGITDGKIAAEDVSVGGGFGWTDFLGTGSEKAMGPKMRRLERKMLAPKSSSREGAEEQTRKMILIGECNLDNPHALEALRKVLAHYSTTRSLVDDEPTSTPPLAFVLFGSFVSTAAMAGAATGSIEYKEHFNSLAAVLSDFPSLLRSATFVFVPGDRDPWASAFSAGASTPVPRNGVPALFTSRVKRAFAAAKAEAPKDDAVDGEAVWTSNPARLTLFGAAHEIVLFRDDISGRMRRTAVGFGKVDEGGDAEMADRDDADLTMSGALPDDAHNNDTDATSHPRLKDASTTPPPDPHLKAAKQLILSLLPQSHLSPFPLATRPLHWDFSSALSLYPLPHTLILCDAEAAPFAVTFEGCHVINPGRLVKEEGRRRRVAWVEYDVWSKRGEVKETWF
ncbi:DNA-directed DNA polymerase epsilon, subunit B [Taxawa tesnikishii (nom. ined.)]|nr:DNA-directed DNA polymerase epsilon, subunit B [Dothideales sp. JES 119]